MLRKSLASWSRLLTYPICLARGAVTGSRTMRLWSAPGAARLRFGAGCVGVRTPEIRGTRVRPTPRKPRNRVPARPTNGPDPSKSRNRKVSQGAGRSLTFARAGAGKGSRCRSLESKCIEGCAPTAPPGSIRPSSCAPSRGSRTRAGARSALPSGADDRPPEDGGPATRRCGARSVFVLLV